MADTDLKRLIGDVKEVAIERALAEIRSGRPVLLNGASEQCLVMSAETLDDKMLASIKNISGPKARLVLSQPRLRLLGYETVAPGIVPLADMTLTSIHELVSHTGVHINGYAPQRADIADIAALELVRLSYLLPAAIVVPLSAPQAEAFSSLVAVDADTISHYRENVATSLSIVARAPVPLEDAADSEFVVFRGGEGMRDQVAVVIGNPDPAEPVHVRLHSACLTGDLFSSLKCDCGDQLRGSVKQMAELGGGILLYLDQEGRGNGIANKIRAYRLQHAGYNTYDADEILGFGLDQRRFDFAATMLKQLGHHTVRLLTNNPSKVMALQEAGLDVVSNHRTKARHTIQNIAYLAAKRDRAGHMIEEDLKI